MKKLLLTIALIAPLFVRGQTNFNGLNITKISQFPIATSVPTNSLFIIAIPGQANYAIYAAPLINGLLTLQSNYASLTNLIYTPGVAVNGLYIMSPSINTVNTNVYLEDFGQKNQFGQTLIYAMVSATNDFVIGGQTNTTIQGQNLSYGVVSSVNPFMRIWLPTNGLVHFSTNYGPWNFYVSNNYYVAYITNGSLFRMSMQTNLFIERRWLVQ